MQLSEKDIIGMMEEIWSTMLGLEIDASAEGRSPANGERTLTGCVQIMGEFDGAVILECTEKLARRATAAMFEVDPEAASPEEIQDALGELANMVGGGVKTLLGGSCRLSLPSVSEGTDYVLSIPGSKLQAQVSMASDGEPVIFRLLMRAEEKEQRGS